MELAPYNIALIIITVIVSFIAFNNQSVYNKLILWPAKMHTADQYYRLITSGFIHADYQHIFFNLFTLYFFGSAVEGAFIAYGIPHIMFLVLYVAGIVIASLPSFVKNRNNNYYRSLGASGGVSAVLFAFVYFAPWQTIRVWFIPIPGVIAAIAYLIYSAYMTKNNRDNVNHNAHIWGAIFGFFFTLIVDPSHGQIFLERIMKPSFSL